MTTFAIASGLQTLVHLTYLRAYPDYARFGGSFFYQALTKGTAQRALVSLDAGTVLSWVSKDQLCPCAVMLVLGHKSRISQGLLHPGARCGAFTRLNTPMYVSKFHRNLQLISHSFNVVVPFGPFVGTSRIRLTQFEAMERLPVAAATQRHIGRKIFMKLGAVLYHFRKPALNLSNYLSFARRCLR